MLLFGVGFWLDSLVFFCLFLLCSFVFLCFLFFFFIDVQRLELREKERERGGWGKKFLHVKYIKHQQVSVFKSIAKVVFSSFLVFCLMLSFFFLSSCLLSYHFYFVLYFLKNPSHNSTNRKKKINNVFIF